MWRGEYLEVFRARESLEGYVESIRVKKEQLVLDCRKAKEVVIYGAGNVGRYFLENYGKEYRCIVGFVISQGNRKDLIEGYNIREIKEYSREFFVIMAVGKQFMAEIMENLNQTKYENISCVDFTALKLLERL